METYIPIKKPRTSDSTENSSSADISNRNICCILLHIFKQIISSNTVKDISDLKDGTVLIQLIQALSKKPLEDTKIGSNFSTICKFLNASNHIKLAKAVNWLSCEQGKIEEIMRLSIFLLVVLLPGYDCDNTKLRKTPLSSNEPLQSANKSSLIPAKTPTKNLFSLNRFICTLNNNDQTIVKNIFEMAREGKFQKLDNFLQDTNAVPSGMVEYTSSPNKILQHPNKAHASNSPANYREILRRKEKLIESLRKERFDDEDRISQLVQQRSDDTTEIDSLKKELRESKMLISQLRSLTSETYVVDDLKTKVEQLSKENKKLNSKLTEFNWLKEDNPTLAAENAKLLERVADLEEKYKTLKYKIINQDHMNEEMEAIQQRTHLLETELRKKQLEITNGKEQIEELMKSIETYKEQLSERSPTSQMDSSGELVSLVCSPFKCPSAADMQSLEEEILKLSTELLDHKTTTLHERYSFSAEKEKIALEMKTLQKTLSLCQSDNRTLIDDKKVLTNELTVLSEKFTDVEQNVGKLTYECKELVSQLQQRDAQFSSLNSEIEVLSLMKCKLEGKCQEYITEYEKKVGDLEESNRRDAEHHAAFEKMQKAFDSLKAQCADLETKHENLEVEIIDIKLSHCAEVDGLQRNIGQLEATIKDFEVQGNKLKCEKEDLENLVRNLVDNIKSLTVDAQSKDSLLRAKEEQIYSIENQLEALKIINVEFQNNLADKKQVLKEKIVNFENEVSSLMTALADSHQRLEEKNEELELAKNAFENEKKVLLDQIIKLEEESLQMKTAIVKKDQCLQDKIHELDIIKNASEAEKTNFHNQLDNFFSVNETLQAKILNLEEECAHLKLVVVDTEKCLQGKKQEEDALLSKNQNLEATILSHEEEISKLRTTAMEKNQHLQQKTEEFEFIKRTTEEDKSSFERYIANLSTEKQSLQTNVLHLEEECAHLKTVFAEKDNSLQEKINELKSVMSVNEVETCGFQNKLKILINENQSLQSQIVKLEEECLRFKTVVLETNQHLQEKSQEITFLKNSVESEKGVYQSSLNNLATENQRLQDKILNLEGENTNFKIIGDEIEQSRQTQLKELSMATDAEKASLQKEIDNLAIGNQNYQVKIFNLEEEISQLRVNVTESNELLQRRTEELENIKNTLEKQFEDMKENSFQLRDQVKKYQMQQDTFMEQIEKFKTANDVLTKDKEAMKMTFLNKQKELDDLRSSSEVEINLLSIKLSEFTENLTIERERVEGLKNEIKKHEYAKEEAFAKVKYLEVKEQTLQSELVESQRLLENTFEDFKKLQCDFDRCVQEKGCLEKSLMEKQLNLEKEINILKSRVIEFTENSILIGSLQEQIQTMSYREQNLSESLAKSQEDVQGHLKKIECLTKEIQELESVKENLPELIESLKVKNGELQNENHTLADELNSVLSQTDTQIHNLTCQLEKRTFEREDLANMINKMKDSHQAQMLEGTELLNKAKQENDKLNSDKKNMQSRLDNHVKKVQELCDKLANAEEEINKKQSLISLHVREIDALKATDMKIAADLTRCNVEVTELRNKIKIMEDSHKIKLERQNQMFQKEKEYLLSDINTKLGHMKEIEKTLTEKYATETEDLKNIINQMRNLHKIQLNQQNETLQKALQDKEKYIEINMSKVEQIKREFTELLEKHRSTVNQLEEKQAFSLVCIEKIETLESSIQALDSQLNKQVVRCEELLPVSEAREEQLKQLCKEQNNLEAQLKEKDSLVLLYNSQTETLNSNIKHLEARIKKMVTEKESLLEEITCLSGDLIKAQNYNETFLEEINSLKGISDEQVNSLRENLNKTQGDNEAFKREINSIKESNNIKENFLSEELESAKQRVKEFEKEISSLKTINTNQVKSLSEELVNANQQVEECEKGMCSLKETTDTEVNCLNKELEKAQQRIDECLKESNSLKDDYNKIVNLKELNELLLKNQIESLKDKEVEAKAQCRKELDDLDQQYKEFKVAQTLKVKHLEDRVATLQRNLQASQDKVQNFRLSRENILVERTKLTEQLQNANSEKLKLSEQIEGLNKEWNSRIEKLSNKNAEVTDDNRKLAQRVVDLKKECQAYKEQCSKLQKLLEDNKKKYLQEIKEIYEQVQASIEKRKQENAVETLHLEKKCQASDEKICELQKELSTYIELSEQKSNTCAKQMEGINHLKFEIAKLKRRVAELEVEESSDISRSVNDWKRHISCISTNMESTSYLPDYNTIITRSRKQQLDASTCSPNAANNSAITSFVCEEEEGHFNDHSKNLSDLKAGICKIEQDRLLELQRRNTLCLPHQRTAYPVETQLWSARKDPTSFKAAKKKFDFTDAVKLTNLETKQQRKSPRIANSSFELNSVGPKRKKNNDLEATTPDKRVRKNRWESLINNDTSGGKKRTWRTPIKELFLNSPLNGKKPLRDKKSDKFKVPKSRANN